jgi:hypothetical protein
MLCDYCHKKIRFEEKAYWLNQKPHHLSCFARAVNLERKTLAEERAEREQKELVPKWFIQA